MDIIASERVRKDFSASPNETVSFSGTVENGNITLGVSGNRGGSAQLVLSAENLTAFIEFAQAVGAASRVVD